MKFRLLSILLLFVFISGCQTTPTKQDAKLLSTNHGYLFVNFLRSKSTLEVKNLETKKKYTLDSGMWLPEGVFCATKS
ncbi:hypothetical protein C1E23_20950, partial [Pseudoalteromonas phenolica]